MPKETVADLETRIQELEARLAEMAAELASVQKGQKDWRRGIGFYKDDPRTEAVLESIAAAREADRRKARRGRAG